jgi:hypothetical protein
MWTIVLCTVGVALPRFGQAGVRPPCPCGHNRRARAPVGRSASARRHSLRHRRDPQEQEIDAAIGHERAAGLGVFLRADWPSGDSIGTDGSRRALGRVDVAVSGGEQDFLIILCAVQDVHDDHRVGVDTVEDQVPAVAAPADP